MAWRNQHPLRPLAAACALFLAAIGVRFSPAAAPSPAAQDQPDVPPAAPEPTAAPADAAPHKTGIVIDVSHEPSLAGLEPTRVSADFDNLSTIDAWDAFAAVSPYPFDVDSARGSVNLLPPASVTLHVKDAPLLEAIMRMWSQTGMSPGVLTRERIYPLGGRRGVSLWCISGPFAIALQKIEIGDLLGPGGERRAKITMEVLGDPRFNIVKFPYHPDVSEMVDENNHSLSIAPPARPPGPTAQVFPMRLFTNDLKLPENRGVRIARFRGTFDFLVAAPGRTIQSKSPDDLILETFDGFTVRIPPIASPAAPPRAAAPRAGAGRGAIASPPGRYRFEIHLHRDTLPADQWEKLLEALPGVRLQCFDADSKSIRTDYRTTDHKGDDATANYDCQVANSAASPHHFVVEFPGEIKTVHVPFEFKDVPLP